MAVVYLKKIDSSNYFIYQKPGTDARWQMFHLARIINAADIPNNGDEDNFRIKNVSLVDLSGSTPIGSTTSNIDDLCVDYSNWEYALSVTKDKTLIGGIHGYTDFDSISISTEDGSLEIDAGETLGCNQLKIRVVTGLYHPEGGVGLSNGLRICTVTTTYTWNGTYLIINNSYDWHGDYTVRIAYAAMFPVKRSDTISSHGQVIGLPVETLTESRTPVLHKDSALVTLWNNENNLRCSLEVLNPSSALAKYAYNGSNTLGKTWINNLPSYNKIYISRVHNPKTEVVHHWTKWNIQAKYKVWNSDRVGGPAPAPVPGTAKYNGTYTPLAALQELQQQTGIEFQFRYEYDEGIIKRYVDLYPQIGKVHPVPIELGYNAQGISLEIDESEVRIAAGPVGIPDKGDATFHLARKSFEDQAISTSTEIPMYVTKDDEGNAVNGPMVYPPYNKAAGAKYVETTVSSELTAAYRRIQKQTSEGSGSYPRIWTFESSEENKYNLYWECVDNIRQHIQPQVTISCTLLDLLKLEGAGGEHYNVGDVVYIRLPGRTDVVECRITLTTKDPRNPETEYIEISTHKTRFMRDFFKRGLFKSPGSIQIYPVPPA